MKISINKLNTVIYTIIMLSFVISIFLVKYSIVLPFTIYLFVISILLGVQIARLSYRKWYLKKSDKGIGFSTIFKVSLIVLGFFTVACLFIYRYDEFHPGEKICTRRCEAYDKDIMEILF